MQLQPHPGFNKTAAMNLAATKWLNGFPTFKTNLMRNPPSGLGVQRGGRKQVYIGGSAGLYPHLPLGASNSLLPKHHDLE